MDSRPEAFRLRNRISFCIMKISSTEYRIHLCFELKTCFFSTRHTSRYRRRRTKGHLGSCFCSSSFWDHENIQGNREPTHSVSSVLQAPTNAEEVQCHGNHPGLSNHKKGSKILKAKPVAGDEARVRCQAKLFHLVVL